MEIAASTVHILSSAASRISSLARSGYVIVASSDTLGIDININPCICIAFACWRWTWQNVKEGGSPVCSPSLLFAVTGWLLALMSDADEARGCGAAAPFTLDLGGIQGPFHFFCCDDL
jgi:hypothetical protein